MRLDQLTSDADIALFQDVNGDGRLTSDERLARSILGGAQADSINISALTYGEYYLQVNAFFDSETNYRLSLSTALSEPGSLVNNAAVIGTLTGQWSINGSVSPQDSRDRYMFQLAETSDLQIYLGGLSNDADLRLYYDANGDGSISSNERIGTSLRSGTQREQISLNNLSAGTYYVDVDRYLGSTNYNLQLTADTAGATFNSARTIDLSSGQPQVLREFVGAFDPSYDSDIFRINLTETSDVQITLDQLSADADILLIQDTNRNGILDLGETLSRSILPGISLDQITVEQMSAGQYFIVVTPGTSTANTNYRLSIVTDRSANPTSPSLSNWLQGNYRANTFTPIFSGGQVIISGNGNIEFGSGERDQINLSQYLSTNVSFNLASATQGGVRFDPGNGERMFDAINFTDGQQILFEGIDTLVFADRTISLSITPNDPLFNYQWNLHATGVHNDRRYGFGIDWQRTPVLLGIGDSKA
ncbi:MAG: hypothetical protein HC800_24860 [Phormidesmis sp. RL_2_1]|nr:hypothetical protein [Phormidesmis sp. RL_2_1]